jgi:hypothetical protein
MESRLMLKSHRQNVEKIMWKMVNTFLEIMTNFKYLGAIIIIIIIIIITILYQTAVTKKLMAYSVLENKWGHSV